MKNKILFLLSLQLALPFDPEWILFGIQYGFAAKIFSLISLICVPLHCTLNSIYLVHTLTIIKVPTLIQNPPPGLSLSALVLFCSNPMIKEPFTLVMVDCCALNTISTRTGPDHLLSLSV